MSEPFTTFTPSPFRDFVRVECWMCHGNGRVLWSVKHPENAVLCPNCAGNGTVLTESPLDEDVQQ